jgi:hypothetical protein
MRNCAMAALDRIEARAPQRATFRDTGVPLYLHECGQTESFIASPNRGSYCRCENPGTWQALYVLPDGA